MYRNRMLYLKVVILQPRNNVPEPDVVPESCHFAAKNHNFSTYAKFILIEHICHIDIDEEKNKERLKQKGKLLDINIRNTNA